MNAHLEIPAKLDQIRHALVHLALDDSLLLLRKALLLICDEISEASNKSVGARLFIFKIDIDIDINKFPSREI